MFNYLLRIISQLTQHRETISLNDIETLRNVATQNVLALEQTEQGPKKKMHIAYQLTDHNLEEMGLLLPGLLIETALEAAIFSLREEHELTL